MNQPAETFHSDSVNHRPSPTALALLRDTLERSTAFPKVHNQATWLVPRDGIDVFYAHPIAFDPARPTACGTVGCVAGNAVLLSGRYELRVNGKFDGLEYEVQVKVNNEWYFIDRWASDIAGTLLELTSEWTDALFDGQRTLAELWLLVEELTGSAITPPDALHVTDDDRDFVSEVINDMREEGWVRPTEPLEVAPRSTEPSP